MRERRSLAVSNALVYLICILRGGSLSGMELWKAGGGWDGEELTNDPYRVTEAHFPYFTIWPKARRFMAEEGEGFENAAKAAPCHLE